MECINGITLINVFFIRIGAIDLFPFLFSPSPLLFICKLYMSILVAIKAVEQSPFYTLAEKK